MKKSPMTAIRLHDGTTLYCRDIEIDARDGIWTLKNVRSPDIPRRIEEFKLHEDSIEVWFVCFKGEKNVPKSTDGAPAST